MKSLPTIDFGHTSFDSAFERRDVYGIKTDLERSAKRRLNIGIVGCGGVAQAKWLPAVRYLQTRSEPVDIAGVVDPMPRLRRRSPAYMARVATLRSPTSLPGNGSIL